MGEESKRSFVEGVKDIAPILLGIMPFGMISGITAVNVGISRPMAMAMSVFIFAGASQLAAYQLIASGAISFVIIYTALVVNLRFVVYSASIAPYFQSLSTPWKWVCAYLLTDQGYAVSLIRFRDDESIMPVWYYLGCSVTLWFTWQVFSAIGIFLGSAVPGHWGLDFAIPLTFMAVLVKSLDSRPAMIAAVVGGVVAVVANPLPMNSGLIIGVLSGILTGFWADRAGRRRGEKGEND
ncbi:MAG: AzlC family ABC transporter permease [Clostridia bacterium]